MEGGRCHRLGGSGRRMFLLLSNQISRTIVNPRDAILQILLDTFIILSGLAFLANAECITRNGPMQNGPWRIVDANIRPCAFTFSLSTSSPFQECQVKANILLIAGSHINTLSSCSFLVISFSLLQRAFLPSIHSLEHTMAGSNSSDSAFEPVSKQSPAPKRKVPSDCVINATDPCNRKQVTSKPTTSKLAATKEAATTEKSTAPEPYKIKALTRKPSTGKKSTSPSKSTVEKGSAVNNPKSISPDPKKRSLSPETSHLENLSKKKARVSPSTASKKEMLEASGTSSTKTPGAPSSSGKKDSPEAPTTPLNGEKAEKEEKYPSPPHLPATVHDKNTWQGFCEIESDPVFFSAMIREMGVNGVCVRESYAATPDAIMDMPQPVYGIILLFRFRPVDAENEEADCPENVWFANQLPAQNSCATLAILNILLNLKGVDIGDHLQQFKEYSQGLTPYQRGQALSSFEFVKRIHNSFAKKQDMLQEDQRLALKVAKTQKSRRMWREDRRKSTDSAESIEDNANHFIAFLPIDGEVWKLDGMDAQPTSIGKFKDEYDWISIVAGKIGAVMQAAGDNDYNVMALTQSPLVGLRKDMRTNIAIYKAVEARLDSIDKDWSAFWISNEDRTLPDAMTSPGLLTSLGTFQDQLSVAMVPDYVQKRIDGEDLSHLVRRRDGLLQEQSKLQESIMNEMTVEAEEDAKANERRWDYGPVISLWLQKLAANGYLEANLDRFTNLVTLDNNDGTPLKSFKYGVWLITYPWLLRNIRRRSVAHFSNVPCSLLSKQALPILHIDIFFLTSQLLSLG
ncbi:cysteine proteinase [Lindgomyces ingoldianus]|uniref:Cysteine proteinase n=1 Tax=Lindgomyces ingoldianus TaxID=673940 RepID=A0ACB6QK27_9PLEO|nr:cysteine proteinase [Lindgomyces ingoldianus]KAF2466490.1 cysteine proteinase [Lindgomyces ingoldianus]